MIKFANLAARCALVCLAWHLSHTSFAAETLSPRRRVSLNGEWQFRRDGTPSNAWKAVSIPSSFQSHEGAGWHGVGWYRKLVKPGVVPENTRLLVEFSASATETEVWWNGERLGAHLGGWTPFRLDATAALRKAAPGQLHEIHVRVDEKVGHNTQGFLPIIAPHFGGLWQSVSLVAVPAIHIDDLSLLCVGDRQRKELRLEIPVAVVSADDMPQIQVMHRLRGTGDWITSNPRWDWDGKVARGAVALPNPRDWSPADPALYELELALGGEHGDRVRTRAAFRSIDAFGSQLRLNGTPLQVRGLLNWGYSPPAADPNPGETRWREELEFARERGFNLMKFCLWVPPKRYLELADELGMLTWMEYPTWHPTLTASFLEPLRREFTEFFALDRNHPSVIVRSLTCETGPSAELPVIKELYDTAHAMIPGALVEDDSSWIGWNRIHDFYDDHPYGNNHTWVNTLRGFNEYILGHGLKPLLLGECMAADTWPKHEQLTRELGTNRPWHAPGVLDDLPRWESRMKALGGPQGIEHLRPDSLRYALLMRKYQAETFRREIPYGGYVISVIRDVPIASMGLIDYTGAPKWSPADWAWQRDTLLLLKTPSDHRAFASGQQMNSSVLLSHFGPAAISKGQLAVSLAGRDTGTVRRVTVDQVDQNAGTLAALTQLDWTAPEVNVPTRFLLTAVLTAGKDAFTNQWPVWVVPAAPGPATPLQFHSSIPQALREELLTLSSEPASTKETNLAPGHIVVASRFDDELARFLEAGGRVLLLPDGQRHSFPLSAHWFLRGAPYIPTGKVLGGVPRDLLLELQHFDLASDVVPDLAHLESFQPWLMLWDTHDQKTTVKTHGLVFETRVGPGRLLVSALQHRGPDNPAGRWLLGMLINHLADSDPPAQALRQDVWDYAKRRIRAEHTNLADLRWSFRPDPKDEGLARRWHTVDFVEDATWKPIKIGAWWESQGYGDVDKWAWYRLSVEVPARWKDKNVYLSFEGVDDIYELYVNGSFAGKGGDLATRRDALQEKTSFDITPYAQPGKKVLLAVRVHDWYGAGGIFRPVTLGTLPLRPELDLLK